MDRPHHKKCPACGSGRISVRGTKISCLRCPWSNDLNPKELTGFGTYKAKQK